MARKTLTLDDILAAPDLETKTVSVPAWGGDVQVKGLSKREQQQLRKQAVDPATGQIDPDRLEVLMLAHCLAEPRITVEQAEQLAQKSAAPFDAVLMAIYNIAGWSAAAQKAMMRTFHIGDEGSPPEPGAS